MAKTKGVKNCTRGNKKCGGRCIPSTWDCRLKGEGQDKALKASQGLDLLSTAAQVQRGTQRFVKGLQKQNFSEADGGRRQLIRVVSRNSRGEGGRELNLKEKKELQRWSQRWMKRVSDIAPILVHVKLSALKKFL